MNPAFVSAPVPFRQCGNRRALSRLQLMQDPYLKDFVDRFRHHFEYDPVTDFYLFIEPDIN